MGNINFRERRLFSLFSSTFVSLLATVLLTRQCFVANGEFFTALNQWEILIRVENNFVELLDKYIVAVNEDKNEDHKIEDLIKFLKEVKPRVDEAVMNPEHFVSHPVNGFLMIKRFTSDWLEIESILNNRSSIYASELSNSIQLHKSLLPLYDDLKGAAGGLLRLQDTYKLSAQDISSGQLSKQFPNAIMDTEDCFQVGLIAYHDQDYGRTKEWMVEALRKYNPKIYSGYLNRRVLQEYIAWSEYETGNVTQAINLTQEILKNDPNNIIAKNNLVFFQNALKNNDHKKEPSRSHKHDYMDTYTRLCRGETKKNPKDMAKLTCYYDKSTPNLVIKPAKIEILNIQPRIVKYKKIITDEEIWTVQKIANPRLRRATINNLATGKLEFAKYRISKSAWISDDESEVVERLSKRIGSLTGLDTSWNSAEQMQVANYGIGGHYEPHWDHATNHKASIFAENKGNRIATFLIYMSDIESGGYTVFLNAEAVVKPSKGDAVFWYNLRRSGAGDSTTRHAACPVIVGSKWVSNKWIHAYGQEFRRRCGLNYDGLPGELVAYEYNAF